MHAHARSWKPNTHTPTQTRGYVTDEILHNEPEEGLEKLQDAMKVCRSYKVSYTDRRDMLSTYFKDPEVPMVEWSFQPAIIFSRLDMFIQQLATIEVSCCVMSTGGIKLLSVY